jgi:DNA-binding CsgD family transcriptional regulator
VTGGARPAHDRGSGVVGREAEVAALRDFVGAAGELQTLVIAGGPGIGKSTLWDVGLELAREHGVRVLAARPSDAEATLAFSALIDLFDGVDSEELADVPAPQRHALEVALLRAAPVGPPRGTHAVAVGALNALRVVSTRTPLLVAIDDIEWLDSPSATALAFVGRRLDSPDVRFLLARRPGASPPLEQALEPGGLEHRRIAPLSFAATRRLLHARLGLSVPRQVMRQIVDVTLGNPLFALEIGRTLTERGMPAIGEDLPVPEAVDDLLGTRVAALPAGVRRLLLAVALGPGLDSEDLVALEGQDALDEAIELGVLTVEGADVRASHPLLAAAATRAAFDDDRRAAHRALASVVSEEQLRVRHLALATPEPERALATAVAEAAAEAAGRGAPHAAVELAEHALRLTPAVAEERTARVIELARYLDVAGELQRLTDLLAPELEAIPERAQRVQACLLLSSGVVAGNEDIRRHLDRALLESGDDALLRIQVLAELAANDTLARVERIVEAEEWAAGALPEARRAGPHLEKAVLYVLGWARSLRGRPIDDLWARFRDLSDEGAYVATSLERVAAQRLAWRGEVQEARAVLTRLLETADERGEASSYTLQRLHLCELELRSGAWTAAARLLDEWAEPGEQGLMFWPMYDRCRALLAVGVGRLGEGREWVARATERAQATGVRWDALEAVRAQAMARLLSRDPAEAAAGLRSVWEHTQRVGVEDPAVFPVAPDLVEALAELGELEEASTVTARLGELAERQSHPWGRASAQRCVGVVELARAYDERAVTALEEAEQEYGRLGLVFDRGRTLLALGRAQRRSRQWGDARQTLERAVAVFDQIGSVGWCEAAGSELARAGARRPRSGGALTPTERRVAELAAQGLSNKEIARTLVVTVGTVEFHLSNVYRKLDVRSRARLAAQLATPSDPPTA